MECKECGAGGVEDDLFIMPRFSLFRRWMPGAFLVLLAVAVLTVTAAEKPGPTVADIAYGSALNQRLDVYLPPGQKGPFPVLVWYGGIWKPARHAPDVGRFWAQGIAVVAVGTRTLTDGVDAGEKEPVSYVMKDAIRAVQFLRLNASKWNLNTARIAVGGGSQGSLPALFAGCAPDQARPDSTDPVERMSSLVTCVAAYRSQPSIDPVQMQAWVPGVKWGAPALGCSFEESLRRRDELLPVIRRWSPDALLHAGAAPTYFENNWGLIQPEGVGLDDYKVHSPAWALGFQQKAAQSGAVCLVKYPGHDTEGYADIWDFIVKKLMPAS